MTINAHLSPSDYMLTLAQAIHSTQATIASGDSIDLDPAIRQCVQEVVAVRRAGKMVFCVGNGGSAAMASHVCNDLLKSVRVRAHSLTDVSILTAFANDEGYENVYCMPLQRLASAGDLLIAISSSGRSNNILRTVAAMRKLGGGVITLSGFATTNPLRQTGDVNLYVPSEEYGFVELAHASLMHCITDLASVESDVS